MALSDHRNIDVACHHGATLRSRANPGGSIRTLAALGALLALLLPGVAAADPPDCARQLRQINHYEGMVSRAQDMGRTAWASQTQAHVDLLEDRLAARCPNYTARDEQQEAARQIARLLKVAADAAVTFFTMGAL